MSGLVDFLLDRIAEDEAAARAATAGPWRVVDAGDRYVGWRGRIDTTGGLSVIDGAAEFAADLWLDVTEADLTHVARWNPARVLDGCEARRRLVEVHELIGGTDTWDAPVHGCGVCIGAGTDGEYLIAGPCSTLRLLAQPYADHPAYRQEWAP